MPGPVMLYDDDCGFCMFLVQFFLAWDRDGKLRTLPIQRAGALLDHLDPAERLESWHLAEPDGRVTSGGAAFPPLLRLLPGGRPLAAAAARIPRLSDRGYRWVARNRVTLSKPIPAAWKQSAGRRVRARASER